MAPLPWIRRPNQPRNFVEAFLRSLLPISTLASFAVLRCRTFPVPKRSPVISSSAWPSRKSSSRTRPYASTRRSPIIQFQRAERLQRTSRHWTFDLDCSTPKVTRHTASKFPRGLEAKQNTFMILFSTSLLADPWISQGMPSPRNSHNSHI